jgi:hypothetical protein
MTDSLNLLISLLKYIDSDDSIETSGEYYSSTNPLVNAARYLANEFLIGDDGHPDRESMDIIVGAGFPIFPKEQDRFGWLTACIELKRGIIIFG